MLRDLLAGQRVQLSVSLEIEEREGLKTDNLCATLPGISDEQLVIVTHTDGFFQGRWTTRAAWRRRSTSPVTMPDAARADAGAAAGLHGSADRSSR